jgi:hypothetical protein
MVAPRLQRRGISRLMLAAMRDNARRLGFVDLYAPLRPTEKHLEPLTPFADYVARQREEDCLTTRGYEPMSWLARESSRWRRTAWSSAARSPNGRRGPGLAFGGSGPAILPGALSPVHVSLEQDYAVYVEPNLWVHHRLV